MKYIDISGPWKQTDTRRLNLNFVGTGELRDGAGLFAWVNSFHCPESKESQTALKAKLRLRRVTQSATLYTLTLDLNDALTKWQCITGNGLDCIDSFWEMVTDQMDATPNTTIGTVHTYISTRRIEGSPLVGEPELFIDRIVEYAKMLKLPPGSFEHVVAGIVGNATDNSKDRGKVLHHPENDRPPRRTISDNDYEFCDLYVCKARKYGQDWAKHCPCKNRSIDIKTPEKNEPGKPEKNKYSVGQRLYIAGVRDHVKKNPETTSVNEGHAAKNQKHA